MATRTAPQPIAHMSEEEFLALVDEKPSLEYIDGAVYRKPATGVPHGDLAGRIVQQLANYADVHGGRGGPEVHIDFSDEFHRIYRVPDVSFWAPGRARRSGGVGLPPTLAVEVRSPSQTLDELREKCRFMLANGVDACWLVDPDTRTVEVFEGEVVGTLAVSDELTSGHLPGFALAVADLFAVLD